jgi:hypothetical protein
MIMLLVGAPVLIDARISRDFLEEAQDLGGEMTRMLTTMAGRPAIAPRQGPGSVRRSRGFGQHRPRCFSTLIPRS